jgi:hypothetical protein
MKKLLLILLLTGCTKVMPPTPAPPPNRDIFSVPQSTVSNGNEITFNLKTNGVYTLTMKDSVTSQVLTRERFMGKLGANNLKIYTRSLAVKYLYLILEDSTKTQVGKTTIVIN